MNTLRFAKMCVLVLFTGLSFAQELTQTVRGTIVDTDTKTPIFGAKVVVLESVPLIGAVSNEFGEFRLEKVPATRVNVRITAIGYQEIIVPSVLVETGKEKILNIEMAGEVRVLADVEVRSTKDKTESINTMATVSAKTFTVEETNRYAGSLNDPARMVSGFAGVVGDASGNNDIIVRGNSPRGILWRLEGIDIPNPNHFAGEGATGGPVNALNGAMLANSDFFSGAFAPEYGNALAGVFDVQFRQGNNEQREYSFSAGVLGIDGTLEGPFKKGYRGSYLVNYRYSSIALLDKFGILDFDGIPIYQDASFKLHFPTQKAGSFSLVGLGGISHILQTATDSIERVTATYDFGARLGMVGLKHMIVLNPKVYVKSYLSVSTAGSFEKDHQLNQDSVLYHSLQDAYDDHKFKAQSILNYKFNQKNIFQIGATYTHSFFEFVEDRDDLAVGKFTRVMEASGDAGMLQSFVSWKYKLSNQLSVVSGVHYTQLLLNNSNSFEPRVGVKWRAAPRHTFSVGLGMHSKVESISTYLYNQVQTDGSFFAPNRDLEFSKSNHSVLGYGFQINENMHVKTEVYYQHLYNVPVAKDSGDFSMINSSEGIPDVELINKGTGRNYGLELTLERFFANNFYFLVSGSLYKSTYATLDGIEHDSRYDAGFASNFLLGKEFKLGELKNKTIGINTKVSLLGGNRFTPINLEASQAAGYTIRDLDRPYASKGDEVFILNLGVTYRVDMKKTSHSVKIDIQNITNHQAVVSQYYDAYYNRIESDTQLSLVPNIIYTVKF